MKLKLPTKTKSANAIRKEKAIAFAERFYKNAPYHAHVRYNVRDMLQRLLHQQRFPAMHLHPMIVSKSKNHWQRLTRIHSHAMTRRANYGKGQVLFTMREGGTWQKWPWSWVPELPEKGVLLVSKPGCNYTLKPHSMLINGRRWDCINGWNSYITK